MREHRWAPGGQAGAHDARPTARESRQLLYSRVYDPFTRSWFDALGAAPGRAALLRDVRSQGLLATLRSANTLCYELVDQVMDQEDLDVAGMVELVSRLRDRVLWAGHSVPGPEADVAEVRDCLARKLKRNVSLGLVEALICLQSAVDLGRSHLGLAGEPLVELLRRSRSLYASLAVLHDDQEQVQFQFLTGMSGALRYPETDFEHVLRRDVSVPAGRFIVTGPASAPRLRFSRAQLAPAADDEPAQRCPAQRIMTRQTPARPLNDLLWDLLIDLYRASGSLD